MEKIEAVRVKGLAISGQGRQSRTSQSNPDSHSGKTMVHMVGNGISYKEKDRDQEVMTKAQGKPRLLVVASLNA